MNARHHGRRVPVSCLGNFPEDVRTALLMRAWTQLALLSIVLEMEGPRPAAMLYAQIARVGVRDGEPAVWTGP